MLAKNAFSIDKESNMFRDLSISEISSVFGGSGVAVYTNGSWSYGNACYATAQGAANAGATGFSVNGKFFGDVDGIVPQVHYTQEL